jgi:hypothetical protein
MRVFLEGWPIHKGRSAIVLYGLIQSDPQIRDICRNPLLLTILTGLYLDTDDFQIPSSRELFYQNAVDELLVRRPARRQIKQQFEANDKRQILERVALERLETVETNEDPEELTQDALREKAEKILRNDKFDFHALIKEVVEINGIIKPMHENTYSCAHRTILEYFAAREALRSRETWKVVTTFGDRPELIEVLYFYCGLLKNLPALATIVEEFIKQNRWLEAGRSLVFMNEAPNSVLVREVVSQLHDAIVNEIEINASLEALSSLANRRDPEFGIARELFANAIDRLSSSDETGASALESAIATSPEIALKLIPNLLRHHSERWRAAGVQLLRDIGTEEALDGLVQLLKDTDPYVRGRAGFVLAGMIKTRNRALRGRARLLPETQDKAVWPLERFFPGSVAIPIAEALAPNGNSESEAINHAIRAISMREKGMDDASLRRWRRVPLDAVLQYYRHRVADLVTLGVRGVGIAAVLILFIVQSICYFSDRGVLISLSPLHFTMLYGHDIRPINDRAKTILSEIEAAYPPAVHGLRRILPWYWDVLPSIPEEKQQTFTVLKRFASSLVTPTTIISSGDLTPELKTLASSTDVEDLGRNVASLSAQLKLVKEGSHFWISPLMDWFRFSTIIVMFCTASVWVSILIFRVRMSGSLKSFRFSVGWDPFVVTAAYWVILFIAIPDKSWYLFVVFGSIILAFICSRMIGLFNWPNNPLLKTVNEVQGIAETRFDFRPAHLV